jgi:hypothetical protein
VKRSLWTLAATALLATGAMAQMNDLMRRDRLNETEAGSALAIARGLGLRLDYVVRTRRELGTQMWNLAPVFYISERSNMDPRRVWQERRRGASWMELDRNRGYYGSGRHGDRDDDFGDPREWDDRYRNDPYRGDDRYRDPYGDDRYRNDPYYNDRYDDQYRNRRGGLADLVDDILGRRDNDDYYSNNRNRYGRGSDRQYEQRVWDQILQRAYGHNTSRTWRFLDRGMHIGDIALASYVARVASVQPERVLDELARTKNWSRVRERFGIGSDWESRGRYRGDDRYRDDDRYRNGRNRDILDDIFDIIR